MLDADSIHRQLTISAAARDASRRRRRVLVALVPALLAGLAVAANAAATNQPAPSPSSPGVAAYVEVVPTAKGPSAVANPASLPAGSTALSAKVVNRIARSGKSGKLLLKAATSPAYGAPETKRPPRRPGPSSAASSASTGRTQSGVGTGAIVAISAAAAAVLLGGAMLGRRRAHRA